MKDSLLQCRNDGHIWPHPTCLSLIRLHTESHVYLRKLIMFRLTCERRRNRGHPRPKPDLPTLAKHGPKPWCQMMSLPNCKQYGPDDSMTPSFQRHVLSPAPWLVVSRPRTQIICAPADLEKAGSYLYRFITYKFL